MRRATSAPNLFEMRRTALVALRILGSLSVAVPATARELPSAFFVAKSDNRNQVHYAVRVNDACEPAGPAPVSPYWRMLERGPVATESLNAREEAVLGVDRQEVEGPTVRLTLRGLRSRPLVVHTWREADGACGVATTMTIGGAAARLVSVFVALRLFGVDHLQLSGFTSEGRRVRERIEP